MATNTTMTRQCKWPSNSLYIYPMKLKYELEDYGIVSKLEKCINFYNAGAVDPFKMDCVTTHKRVKGNPYNHLEKHTTNNLNLLWF